MQPGIYRYDVGVEYEFIDIESDVGVEYDVVEYLQIFESGVDVEYDVGGYLQIFVGVEYNVFVDI